MHYIPRLSLYFQGAIVAASLLGYGIFTSRPSFDRTGFRCSFFHLGFLWIRLGNMLFGAALLSSQKRCCATERTVCGPLPRSNL
jgi:hypothetical protein